jgi:glycosyltransferase involved in cell wall biosynthesis
MSEKKIHVVAIGNYRPDRQISMQRFADLILETLPAKGVSVELLCPEIHLSRLAVRSRELSKWLGYFDKFVVFPRRLHRFFEALSPEKRQRTVVHVCDHSNSPYLRSLPPLPHLITCHDLMAVRLALGTLPGPAVRWSGRRLQSMIRRGLNRAQSVVCNSDNTRQDLHQVCTLAESRTSTIRYQLNYAYAPLSSVNARTLIGQWLVDDGRPMILHVGKNSWYKNRDGLLRIFCRVLERAKERRPRLVVVGSPMTSVQADFIRDQGLHDDVLHIAECPSRELQAFYSLASVFLFPSKYEGFGWPPIEAQACGCPVVAGRGGALGEVLEESALTADWSEEEQLASHVVEVLSVPALSERLREAGFRNVARFQPPRMIDDYVSHYQRLVSQTAK